MLGIFFVPVMSGFSWPVMSARSFSFELLLHLFFFSGGRVFLRMMFPHAESVPADANADRVVMAVSITEKSGFFDRQSTGFVDQFLLHMHAHDLSDEQVMRAQFDHLRHATLEIHRTFANQRRQYVFGRNRGQMRFFELVLIAPRDDAAHVGFARQMTRRNVDHELLLFHQMRKRMPRRLQRDRQHGRVAADDAGPGNGTDVGLAAWCLRGDHDDGHGSQQSGTRPDFFLILV